MSVQSLYELALKINNVMAKIQSELKCGICRSTFSNPVSATCGHVFCKDCLDVVFQRRRVVECPLCRQSINRRSCTPSEQHESLVQGYLQLGRNFLRDSQEQTLSIPKDVAFMDSQVPVDAKVSDSPMRDFRPTPQFVLPKARARRKQPLKIEVATKTSKMDVIAEEAECKENTPLQPFDAGVQNQQPPILARRCEADIVRKTQIKSAEVQCHLPDPNCVCRDLRGSLASFRRMNPDHTAQCSSDLSALFVLMPELKDLLTENVRALCEALKLQPVPVAPTSEAVKPAEEAVEGCSSETLTLGVFQSSSKINVRIPDFSILFSSDDFASDDDDELNATQPPALLKTEVVMSANLIEDPNGKVDKPAEVTSLQPACYCYALSSAASEITLRTSQYYSQSKLYTSIAAQCSLSIDRKITGMILATLQETDRPNSSCTRSSSDVVPQSCPGSEAGDDDDENMDITIQVPFDSIPCDLDCYSSLDIDTDPSDQKPMVISVSRLKCIEDEVRISLLMEALVTCS
ncbi:zinc finger, C3HC4 type [Cooperia oncophora]